MKRRRLLAVLGGSLPVALAGCNGGSSDGGDDTNENNTSGGEDANENDTSGGEDANENDTSGGEDTSESNTSSGEGTDENGTDDDIDGGSDTGNPGSSPSEQATTYLQSNDANNYDGSVTDMTGTDSVTVDVGVGNGFAFGPAAVRVSPGTTVTWRWTGRGGFHNVESAEVPAGGQSLDSGRPTGEEGTTYSETLGTTGVYRYFCNPHQSIGMHGVVVVE